MSIRVMTKVWEKSPQKGTALLLLLAIADFANDDGMAWPGIATLSTKVRMSERYVHRMIKELASAGELKVDYKAGKNGTNRYWVQVDPEPQFTVNRKTRHPEPQFRETLNPGPPEPSVNHQEPPIEADPVKVLATVFEKATGITLEHISPKGRGPLYWAPLKQMVKIGDGRAPDILRQAASQLRQRGMNISSPTSLLKTFTSLNGEQQ